MPRGYFVDNAPQRKCTFLKIKKQFFLFVQIPGPNFSVIIIYGCVLSGMWCVINKRTRSHSRTTEVMESHRSQMEALSIKGTNFASIVLLNCFILL